MNHWNSWIPRLLQRLLVLLLVFLSSKLILRSLPGDPLETLIAETGTSIPIETLRTELGLDQAWWESSALQAKRLLIHGDFGRSLSTRLPIGPELKKRIFHTTLLTFSSLLVSLVVSLFLALLTVRTIAEKFLGAQLAPWGRKLTEILGILGAALPAIWMGPILGLLLGVIWGRVPLTHNLILPTLTMSIGISSVWSRLIVSRLDEAMTSPRVAFARALGHSEWTVVWKFGLLPVSGALLAYLGTQIGVLLTGAFVSETLFQWPGMGTLLIESILKRDYPLVEATVFCTASFILIGVWIGDALQRGVDPRLRGNES